MSYELGVMSYEFLLNTQILRNLTTPHPMNVKPEVLSVAEPNLNVSEPNLNVAEPNSSREECNSI